MFIEECLSGASQAPAFNANWRQLGPGQISRLHIYDIASGQDTVVYQTASAVIEAPNWTNDGAAIVFNRDGELYALELAGGARRLIDSGLRGAYNNDHVLDPDGRHIFATAEDGHIYRLPLSGGPARQVTPDGDGLAAHYLHGVSPDGLTLLHIGGSSRSDEAIYNVYALDLRSGLSRALTDSNRPHDGAEFSADGQWIYFNAEPEGCAPGQAQIFRMRRDGSGTEQLTGDGRVNWFPPLSPAGRRLVSISFPPGTTGHPADRKVQLVLADPLAQHESARIDLFGGQGTLNVNSWAPDSQRFAYVDYPVVDGAGDTGGTFDAGAHSPVISARDLPPAFALTAVRDSAVPNSSVPVRGSGVGAAFDERARTALGATGLAVSPICIGSGGLGSVPRLFGYETSADQAVETITAALATSLNFIDTSADYSEGEAERRIGRAIAKNGGLPAGWVLATKVDPDPATGQFDGPAVRRSVLGSLERLGLEHFDLLYLHDPERITFAAATSAGGAIEELLAIREQGLARHLGVAGGAVGTMVQYMRTGHFEVVLTHNRYTLLDRSAESLIAEAQALGLGVVQGAPFGGGVLAKGPAVFDTYAYQPMTPETRRQVHAVSTICAEAGVPLGAAALQFPLRDRRIASTAVGVTRPERIAQTLEWAAWPIPADVWPAIMAASGHDAGLDNSIR